MVKDKVHKVYWKLREVEKLMNISYFTLRNWIIAFDINVKTTKGNRFILTAIDIDKLRLIRKLLWEDKYTMEGAIQRYRQIWKDELKKY